MQKICLKQALLVESTHYKEGDVLYVADSRAGDLIRGGHAEKADEATEVANPNHNPLADAIQPEPPGGANASPIDAALPTVADNPGLIALETASKSGAPRRAAKVSGRAD